MITHPTAQRVLISRPSLSLSDFVLRYYLPFARKNKRSWKMDEGNLERYVLPYLGTYQLDEISAEQLDNWNNLLMSQNFSYGSRFRFFWMLKYVLNCAVRWGHLKDDSKFKSANMPAKPGRSPLILSTKKAKELIQILDEHRKWPAAGIIHLLLITGANLAEILNARWEDIDLQKGTLATSKTFTGRVRLIPLNSDALKLIQKLPRYADIPWLFSTRTGNKLTSIWREWEIIRRELGMPKLCIQDLRHTFAKFLMDTGISQNEVRNIMGHYRIATLENWRKKYDAS
ncbi:MAG: site-specific integrase [Mailhella sp.]|nr:site-specific integrase [Mailhella sp.]